MQTFNRNCRVIVDVADLSSSNVNRAIHVLHVDDDPTILEVSKQILMDMGNFEITHACCVDEAFKKLAAGHYDVVVSDYEMPQKDGLQLLSELREQKIEIPFILFTGKGREEVAIKALNLGADRYFNKQGNTETVYGELAHGITQLASQNRLSKKLSVEEERFRQLFNNIPMAIAVYEAINDGDDFVIKDFNSAAEKIEKIDKAEVLGKRVTQVFSGVKNFGIFDVFKRVWKTGKAEYFPEALYCDNRDIGSWRENWIIKLSNDNIAAIYNDITERKKNVVEIKQKNEMIERVSESIDSGLALIDKDYRVIWANKHLMDLGVALNKKCYQTFNGLGTVCSDCGVKKVFEHKVSLDVHEVKTINLKGETIWIELRVTPLKDKEGNVTAALELVVPITERKKVEASLMESEEKFRLLSEESPNMIFINSKGRVVYANKKCEEITGYSKEEFYSPDFNFLTLNPPEYVEAVKLAYAKHVKGESVSPYEYVLITRDGRRINAIINTTLIGYNGDKAILGIVTDITERKNAEENLKKDNAKMEIVNEKLNVIGKLTRHDVNNKLMIIKSNIYLLKKKHIDKADIVDGFSSMEQAVQEIVRIFDFAKMYEQIGIEELTYINVEEKLYEAAALFSGPIPTIINKCHGLTVLADSFLRPLFFNFIDNTIKYGKKTTTIKMYFESEKNKESLKLVYEDDGLGVPFENKPHIFSEGFSTGGSTGFGLFLTKKMMDVYGWQIQENGTPDEGAKFTIIIPKLNKNGKENYQIELLK